MSSYKDSKVEWAVNKMMELAEEKDIRGIEKINEWGYQHAKGSNSRKDELENGYRAALKRVNEIKSAEKAETEKVEEKPEMNQTERLEASVKSAEQAVEYAIANNMPHVEADRILADRQERLAAKKTIDADKLKTFPKQNANRPHYVTIPQPKPVMTDAERDAYVAETVKYPENYYIESVYCVRDSAESKEFKIQIGFRMKPEQKFTPSEYYENQKNDGESKLEFTIRTQSEEE